MTITSCLMMVALTSALLAGLAQAQTISTTHETYPPMTETAQTTNPQIDALEITGIGVSVETWRNHSSYPKHNLWTAVENSNGSYIISDDPKLYPQNLDVSRMTSAKRKEDAVEAAMNDFMDRYPLPIAVVGPSVDGDASERERRKDNNAGSFLVVKNTQPYTAQGMFAGLLTQSGQVAVSYLIDNPDKLWNTLFQTFDQYPDLPAFGVAAKDGVIQRAADFSRSDRPKFLELAEQAYSPKHARIPSDNWNFITVIRRGRIDWLRPYAPFVKDTMVVKDYGDGDPARNWSEFSTWKRLPPKPFQPTPYIGKPWTPFQIDQYDHLETLGRVQRPQVVSYLNEQGKPVSAAERKVRLEAALRAALAPLGGNIPARVFYDYNSVIAGRDGAPRFLPFVGSLSAVDPEFDLQDTKRSYDLAKILGDLGAGSPFVAVSLATMAGLQSGGATLIANLRRDDGATLILITPPTTQERQRDAAIKRPYWPRLGGYK